MPDVLRATYADLKTVKTRSTVQVILEMPIEALTDVVALLGAPVPGNEVWVAIARLKAGAPAQIEAAANEDKPPRPLSQIAAYLGTIVAFRKWLSETGRGTLIAGAEAAADEVRRRCAISSRKELDTNADAAMRFRAMKAAYDNWLRAA